MWHSRIAVDVAAVHADVGGQRLLALSQLAAEARGGGLLGQALDVHLLVLTAHLHVYMHNGNLTHV